MLDLLIQDPVYEPATNVTMDRSQGTEICYSNFSPHSPSLKSICHWFVRGDSAVLVQVAWLL